MDVCRGMLFGWNAVIDNFFVDWRFLIGFLIAFFFNWIGLIIMCAAFRPKSFKMGAQAGFGADFLCAGMF